MIAASGLRADKRFGQNFLLDLNLTRKIVRLANLPENAYIVEIGPGPGGLTRTLLETGARVEAYELDLRVLPILTKISEFYDNRLIIQMKDALSIDWTKMQEKSHIVANLPYNVATPLLIDWLYASWHDPGTIASMTLMFQQEVAQRITAEPGGKTYGRLSVMCQWLMDCQSLMTLPPSAFTPAPKVHSTVVRFTPNIKAQADFRTMGRVIADAFNQRRKMIRSSLGAYGFDWNVLGINPELRAENLTVTDYVALSNAART